MNKSDVKELCEQIASEHTGWIYHASKFKYKQLGHSEIHIDPSWVLHLSAEPSVIVYNQSVLKILKESFHDTVYGKHTKWMTRMLILSPDAHNNVMIYQKLVHTLPDAEAYIRDFFARGLDLVNRYFYSEDEKIFWGGYPIVGEFPQPCSDEGYTGLGNCLAQALLLNFDYVARFANNELPTELHTWEHYQQRVAEWLPIWQERAAQTGSILKGK